jgi:hypothetical protein
MRHDDAWSGPSSSQQLDAHVLLMTLRQLLNAERLEQVALAELGIDIAVRDRLAEARRNFEDALPGIKHMRDALMHFDDWSRGMGRGPQKDRVRAGEALRDVARDYWPFGHDPDTATISFGPYTIHLDAAEQATDALSRAIYAAAREVDNKNVAERRSRVIEALDAAGIRCDARAGLLKISPGTDRQVWLSVDSTPGLEEEERQELAHRTVAALANVGLRLKSSNCAEPLAPVELVARGQFLRVELDT